MFKHPLFMGLDDARRKMEDWRRDYNEIRPHSALGHKPPITLMKPSSTYGPIWVKHIKKFQLSIPIMGSRS